MRYRATISREMLKMLRDKGLVDDCKIVEPQNRHQPIVQESESRMCGVKALGRATKRRDEQMAHQSLNIWAWPDIFGLRRLLRRWTDRASSMTGNRRNVVMHAQILNTIRREVKSAKDRWVITLLLPKLTMFRAPADDQRGAKAPAASRETV
eukprot:m.253399 g.253399  ORF g.253399 m.253399 type:complete len:152 (+) comp17537_c0_seq2:211-666(+)